MIVSLPERLKYVRILTLRGEEEALVSFLQELGVIHPEVLGEIPEEDLRKLREELKRIEDLEKTVAFLESKLPRRIVELNITPDPLGVASKFNELLRKLGSVAEKVANLEKRREKLREELGKLRRLEHLLSAVADETPYLKVVDLDYEGDVLFSRTLVLRQEAVELLKSVLPSEILVDRVVNVNDEALVILAGFKYVYHNFMKLVKDIRGELLELHKEFKDLTLREYVAKLQELSMDLGRKIEELEERIVEVVEGVAEDLGLSKVVIETYRERLKTLLNSALSGHLAGIEGWVPVSNLGVVEDAIYGRFKYSLVLEVEVEKEPPTLMKNWRPVKPFELITKVYGVPGFREWDPTPVIMYSFIIFFGLMFADAVYGALMIFLVAFILDRTGLIDNPHSEGYLTLKRILITLGISSMVFGILSNSFAGYSIAFEGGTVKLVTTLGEPVPSIVNLTNPIYFITLALIVGLIHVNLAHALSLARGIRERDRARVITETGLFVAEGFGIPYILVALLNVEIPGITSEQVELLKFGALAGVSILIFGRILGQRILGVMMWLFDITGLLGDVLSYTRLAGLGLATYLMAQSFNNLALSAGSALLGLIPVKALGLVAGAIAAVLIMFFMNLLNIVFGIIGSFIHSLRLCFVEFLPKFYEGNGREFRPIRIPVGRYIPVGRVA